ncbi:MAG: hypothetical protein A2096_07230 [Spirochaetes bacterium GWF1_41_5]|nr:MAG: hypothetical protein A2096_07230 [Spirochaetes bacterium GWF1_41_5]HBE00943.1 hypothetical protein [Spirochaetia bacterium]
MTKSRAVFLDRDGTINEEKCYLFKKEDFRILPGVFTALSKLLACGFRLFIATNQSGVARGYYTETDLQILHSYLEAVMLEQNIIFTEILYCPHHPQAEQQRYRINCSCRKPAPGMLVNACAKYNIDHAGSWMIGDKIDDVLAGNNAGLNSILVATGYGREHHEKYGRQTPYIFCRDLEAAASYIIEH